MGRDAPAPARRPRRVDTRHADLDRPGHRPHAPRHRRDAVGLQGRRGVLDVVPTPARASRLGPPARRGREGRRDGLDQEAVRQAHRDPDAPPPGRRRARRAGDVPRPAATGRRLDRVPDHRATPPGRRARDEVRGRGPPFRRLGRAPRRRRQGDRPPGSAPGARRRSRDARCPAQPRGPRPPEGGRGSGRRPAGLAGAARGAPRRGARGVRTARGTPRRRASRPSDHARPLVEGGRPMPCDSHAGQLQPGDHRPQLVGRRRHERGPAAPGRSVGLHQEGCGRASRDHAATVPVDGHPTDRAQRPTALGAHASRARRSRSG
ncbi:hypothetical protein D3C74_328520 [compost metagenome]